MSYRIFDTIAERFVDGFTFRSRLVAQDHKISLLKKEIDVLDSEAGKQRWLKRWDELEIKNV